jgi:hypothetical protein
MPEGKRIISVLWHYYFNDMATTLDFLVINTYSSLTLGIADISVYDIPIVSPTIAITLPNTTVPVSLPFTPNDFNTFNSTTLNLTQVGQPLVALPDGVYYIAYTINPALTYNVQHSIMRTEKIQEKFDNAFMKLDMMICDGPVRTQSKVTLSTINYLIQGSIAAGNNSAVTTANKLYTQADMMLNNFIKNNCNCSGNNYINNFV